MPNTKTKKAVSTKRSNGNTPASHPNDQLEKFFVDQLKDIYWAEKHLKFLLPIGLNMRAPGQVLMMQKNIRQEQKAYQPENNC